MPTMDEHRMRMMDKEQVGEEEASDNNQLDNSNMKTFEIDDLTYAITNTGYALIAVDSDDDRMTDKEEVGEEEASDDNLLDNSNMKTFESDCLTYPIANTGFVFLVIDSNDGTNNFSNSSLSQGGLEDNLWCQEENLKDMGCKW
jgi:hypothetical protein